MEYFYAILITALNAVFWFSILLGLPGAWLMILLAVGVEAFGPDLQLFGKTVLWTAVALALLGEVLEFLLGAAGSARAGGSLRAAALSVLGGIVGGILGTAVPLPVLGTLFGACAGAFVGSLIGDFWAGRTWFQTLRAGRAAAVGRFYGTVSKGLTGGAVFLLLAGSAFF
jgi:uncharacterized protein YqgC (DUF456 family)